MSEQKVIKAYFPTFDADHNEMLLVSHTKENYMPAKQIECYLKSEADKVIAEKESKLQNVSELLKETREWLIDSQKLHKRCADNAVKVIRHQKYRRCLAMAEWCEATALWCYQAANTLPTGFHATLYGKRVMIEPDRLFKRHVLLTKWSARWRELAERLKPNKER